MSVESRGSRGQKSVVSSQESEVQGPILCLRSSVLRPRSPVLRLRARFWQGRRLAHTSARLRRTAFGAHTSAVSASRRLRGTRLHPIRLRPTQLRQTRFSSSVFCPRSSVSRLPSSVFARLGYLCTSALLDLPPWRPSVLRLLSSVSRPPSAATRHNFLTLGYRRS